MMMMNIIIHKETKETKETKEAKEYINTYERVSFIVIVITIDFIIKEQCFLAYKKRCLENCIVKY